MIRLICDQKVTGTSITKVKEFKILKTEKCRDDACKNKGRRIEKVKEQDGMILEKYGSDQAKNTSYWD